jgi:methylated-DNA-[protein]-cysteine S-methyltransferase
MTTYTATVDTSIAPFTVIVDDDGAVLASGWTTDVSTLLPLIHPDLRREPLPRKDLGPVTRAATAYHGGDLTAIDDIAVRQQTGGAFLAAGWKALREIPAGAPITYAELAGRTGNPAAVRAAAQACGRNAAALFVPCHRVIRTGGGLGGFRWGLEVKQRLLVHESAR